MLRFGIGQVALPRQAAVLVAALEGLADKIRSDVVQPDGIRIGNGDVLQILGIDHHVRQIVRDFPVTPALLQNPPDTGTVAQGCHGGHEHIVDLVLHGPLGVVHGHAQGHGQQQEPARRNDERQPPKQGQAVLSLLFHVKHLQIAMGCRNAYRLCSAARFYVQNRRAIAAGCNI